ncbi:ROK family transcriptional regulator [Arthrobacter sp. 35W]|uniref:ROK family transcriptional regulator n=1 Tax=Arthrobacter sp. 35W TaxID=1132441 RepID=UPI00040BBE66|nr:ROK family transcriptional regulator [Arthrobacter sp. 35W]
MAPDAPVVRKSRPGQPGSQSALRQLNRTRITEALASGGPATQAELSRITGLSTATVSNIVKSMLGDGLVTVEPTTSSGRRAVSVALDGHGAIAVGIDFGRTHVRVVLATVGHQIVAEDSVRLPLGHHAEEGIAAAAELLERLLAQANVSRRSIVGAGAGIPGPIDSRSGTVVQGAILPEWVGINLLDRLEEALDLPVFADNDSNLGALAQVTWGPHAAVSNLMFLKIGSGIGSGLILNGAPYYGHVGVTGEIGHATINEHGHVCRCGNRGCLETVASTAIMIELLSRGAPRPVGVGEIVERALAGDAATLRVVEDAGLAVGRAIGNVANLINPEVIVVGGPLAGLGELLLAPIRRGLLRHAVPLVGETTVLVMSSMGDRAEVLGAASLVFQQHGIRRS